MRWWSRIAGGQPVRPQARGLRHSAVAAVRRAAGDGHALVGPPPASSRTSSACSRPAAGWKAGKCARRRSSRPSSRWRWSWSCPCCPCEAGPDQPGAPTDDQGRAAWDRQAGWLPWPERRRGTRPGGAMAGPGEAAAPRRSMAGLSNEKMWLTVRTSHRSPRPAAADTDPCEIGGLRVVVWAR
jgi:hypothetical protein